MRSEEVDRRIKNIASLASVVNKGIAFRVTGLDVSDNPKTRGLIYRLLSRRDRSDVKDGREG